MNRTVNLLLCLGIFVVGIALEAPANDPPKAPKATSEKSCACGTKTVATARTLLGDPVFRACLQYPVYEDTDLVLWSCDYFEDENCLSPFEIFVWMLPGQIAPQSCPGGSPGCEVLNSPALRSVSEERPTCPKLEKPLPVDYRFFDGVKPVRPSTSSNPALKRPWNPKEGLENLGELKTQYVKILKGDDSGDYIYLRLSSGIAEFDQVSFPSPIQPYKLANRKLLLGFESELPPGTPDEVTATPWPLYPDCDTAFLVTYKRVTYHVTTSVPAKVGREERVAPGGKTTPKVQPEAGPAKSASALEKRAESKENLEKSE